MKVFTIIAFLLFFSFNQFHLVDIVTTFMNTVLTQTDFNSDEETPEEEKKESEKELEEFTSSKTYSRIKANPLLNLRKSFSFNNLMFSSPFTQKDIKPPCYV